MNTCRYLFTSWLQVTDTPTVNVTVQNRGSHDMEILPYEGSDHHDPQGLLIPPDTALVNRRISDLFPGSVVAGVASHLHARTRDGDSTVAFISYA
jgi:hypothetical protein